jgi:hypothetical protein
MREEQGLQRRRTKTVSVHQKASIARGLFLFIDIDIPLTSYTLTSVKVIAFDRTVAIHATT